MSAPEQPVRRVSDHLAERPQPCLRCGAPTVHRALLVAAGRVRLVQPRCGEDTHPPRHRVHAQDDESNTSTSPGQTRPE